MDPQCGHSCDTLGFLSKGSRSSSAAKALCVLEACAHVVVVVALPDLAPEGREYLPCHPHAHTAAAWGPGSTPSSRWAILPRCTTNRPKRLLSPPVNKLASLVQKAGPCPARRLSENKCTTKLINNHQLCKYVYNIYRYYIVYIQAEGIK